MLCIDFQINYRCKYRWRTWKSSNRGPEICRCSSHPQYLFSSPFSFPFSMTMTTWALRQFLITMDPKVQFFRQRLHLLTVEQQAVTFFVPSSIRLIPSDTFISYDLIWFHLSYLPPSCAPQYLTLLCNDKQCRYFCGRGVFCKYLLSFKNCYPRSAS